MIQARQQRFWRQKLQPRRRQRQRNAVQPAADLRDDGRGPSRQPAALDSGGVNFGRRLECAPAGGQIEGRELTTSAGLPEDGSHDEASIAQRRVQASSR